ncbi:HIRA interacting protein 3 [Phyllostomus discolor]|uniref:HIRA interacting protein 3 n=3 Tax=Phyllostomus discolor TaxID=89673 RepID=A0A6J2N372_9CHIR|nr:HIRA-interacting protein 3 isoform X2 [Phyllostomus discolor]KAF6124748.1 HIRA interacting protein 3 [Phyllostomus discolor]
MTLRVRKHLSNAQTEAEKKNAGTTYLSWSKMAREDEMREFTRSFFGGRPDLSTLTHSIVRQKFLSHTGRHHLDPEEKQALKRLVEEELLKMQVDEAGAREGLDLVKEARRPPTPCKEPERKRFCLNSESEPSVATSSPDLVSPPAKNGMAAIVSPKQYSKTVESSDGEEQQRDLTAKIGLEKEVMKESCKEEKESSARTNKVWKEESSEEEDGEKKSKGRTRKKPGIRDRTQGKGGKRQSGSSEEDGKDKWRKLRPATKRTGKSAKVESGKTANGEASDLETEVSDTEAEGIPKGKRKNCSYRKSSKRSRTWSSSSSVGSPEPKGGRVRVGWKTTIKNKQAPGEISASRKQAMEENENSEEEPAQRTGNKGAKSHQESEKESEEEETLAKKEKTEEEEEDWKPRASSNRGEKSALSSEQKSRAARVLGNMGERKEEKEKADSGDDSGGNEELLVQRKSKDRNQGKGGKRQSGSSEEDGEDRWRKLRPASKSTGKSAKVESGKTANGEASDSEREVSDSEAGVTLKGERKNRTYRKSSKKCRTRSSSSSSSNGSPEPKGRKAGHHGEDHPAVMRLKRYIRACGAHRNYKKLLGSCRSRKERLCVLRAELEALGMKGNPSLEKCRALKEQREEAAEVASLDITNIISCSGRPRRRTAWNPSEAATPEELYRRALDSEEERRRPPRPDWSHMRGIISSDGESN